MPVNSLELMRAAELVAESRGMTATVNYSLLGAGITSLATFLGGILGGPLGLFAGATSGGVLAYCSTKGKFKPVSQIIKEDLTEAQRERLLHHLQLALKDVDITDAIALASICLSNERTVLAVFNAIKLFVEGDLGMTLMYKNN